MSITPFKTVLPYFELLCFVAAWAVSLSIAWTATHDIEREKPSARIAASDLQNPAKNQ